MKVTANIQLLESLTGKKVILKEEDPNKTWVNPKTGNKVHYHRAVELGLVKPSITPVKTPTAVITPKGHATGPRPKKDPNAPKAWWSNFTKYKLSAYPLNIPQNEVKTNLSGDVNSHWVLQWKHPKSGETISAYTQEFLKRNAELKWKRLTKIKPKDIENIHATANKILTKPITDDKLKEAAANNAFTNHGVKEYLKEQGVILTGGGTDEAPGAYKDINSVMLAQRGLIEVIGKFSPKVVRMADDGEEE